MPAPFTIEELDAVMPNTLLPACSELDKINDQLPRMRDRWIKWIWNDDGTVTEEFANDVCLALANTDCRS